MTSLKERYKAAIQNDDRVAVTRQELDNHSGSTVSYLATLGLSKSDLKKLEKKGLCVRGYMPINEKKAKYSDDKGNEKIILLHDGHQARYILIKE